MKFNIYTKLWFVVATCLLLNTNYCFALNSGKKFIVGLNVLNYDGTKLGIKPGDTVYIEPGHRDHLRLYNIHGDSLRYVVFINNNGLVEIGPTNYNFGLQVYNCSYFRLSGTGSEGLKYGIKIGQTPIGCSGLSLDGSSTNYEVDHIEVAKSGFAGICANPKPDCEDKLNRANFTRWNTIFHDNYVHNTYGEAFYIGHSYYTGYTITCDSIKKKVYPHEIKGLKIYNNLVDSAGWDGIQVGCATTDCEIYGNRVTNYGVQNAKDQNYGILIGGGTGGKCYNNLILNGTGNGINVLGIGNNTIYNNIIINPGYDFSNSVTTSNSCGIFCDDRSTIPGTSFNFINNTIISPKGDGIRFYSTISKNSKIYNNLILKPGSLGNYSTMNKSFVYYDQNVDLTLSNNYFSDNLPTTVNLENLNDIFQYCSTLPVINKGINISSFGINADFNGDERIKDNICDIGAFEFNYVEKQKSGSIKVVPQNSQGELKIYSTKKESLENISIYQLSGQLIYTQIPGNKDISIINTKDILNKGIYLVCVQTVSEESRNKIYINY